MKKLFLLIGLCFVGMQAFSQSRTIIGTVVDTSEIRLPSATIVALSQKDSSIVAFALSDKDGKFQLDDIALGKYNIQVSYLGFNQLNLPLDLETGKGNLDLGTLSMSSFNNELEQVVIKGEHVPLMVKKDTVEYNAAAFQTQPNEVVEDLLKKMPGIEVDEDGTITAQGEEVQQVLVDGKEFFGKDPKIATQNLPAEAVDKIQIYDQKSDMAEFSGVDDGVREKTMNLELKESHKKGHFGNISAGYGFDDNGDGRYEGRTSLNRFGKKMQLSLIANLNNINKQGFSTEQFMSVMTTMGGFGRGRDFDFQNGISNGYVDTEAGGLNLNLDITKKTDLNLSYFVNSVNSLVDRKTFRENLLGNNANYFSLDSGIYNSRNLSHNLNSTLEHEIDSTQSVELRFSLNLSNPETNNTAYSETYETIDDPTNQVLNTTFSNATDLISQLTTSLMYKKKFGPRSISLSGNYGNNHQNLIGNQDFEDLLISPNSFNYVNSNLDDQNSFQVRASYVEPLGIGKYLELDYTRQNYKNNFQNIVSDFDLIDPAFFVDSLSNYYERDYVYDNSGLSYHFNNDKSSFTLEGAVQLSRLQGDIFNPLNSKEQIDTINFTNRAFLPRMTYRYEIARGHNLRLNYSTSVREPSLTQLQPRTDVSNPLNVYVGNPGLNPEYRHRLRLNYFKWDQFNFSSFFVFINASYTTDKITNQTLISEDFLETTSPINVKDDFSLTGSLSYSAPIKKLKMKYRARTNLSFQDQIVFINGVQNDAKRYTTGFSLNLENRKKEKFDVEAGIRLTNTLSTYSESSNRNQNFFNQNYTARGTLTAIKNWSFSSDLNLNIYDQQETQSALRVPIWSASISRFFLEGERGELKLSAFDLLNRNVGITRTTTANYIQLEEINSLGRYYMLSYLYTLKGFGAAPTGGGRGGRGFRHR